MDKLNVFDIQRFSLGDGPGIRTTIFFKGCNLSCRWCHNPESIFPQSQLGYNRHKCQLCGKCITDKNKIKIVDEQLEIDWRANNQNFDLIQSCPNGAYFKIGKMLNYEQLLKEVAKDNRYYESSNGGITISGGEALLQTSGLIGLLKVLKNQNYHICLDVNGCTNINDLQRTIPYVDIYLVDFKLSDEKLMKKYVGQRFEISNTMELLQKYNSNVILRCPIIHNVNLNRKHFEVISKYQKKYPCIMQIDILPYHNLRKNFEFKRYNKYEEFKKIDGDKKWKIKNYCRELKIEKAYYHGRELIDI